MGKLGSHKPMAASTPKKPLVLSEVQLNNIQRLAARKNDTQKKSEEDKKMMEYLKENSAAMIKTWPSSTEVKEREKKLHETSKLTAGE